MSELFQVILINLVVSCDNVGVIALATRNLAECQAAKARRIGIGLSLVLKLLFVVLTGFLLSVPRLHIRIIGGALLLYVTFNMLRQHSSEQAAKNGSVKVGSDSFIIAILSILAADVSMSLDNVIAVLGIISADGHALGVKEVFTVFLGFLICVPVLLWFSGTIARIMERVPILSYICTGYLIYTAINMIFEDETIKLFFEHIHFTFTLPAAILCGVLIVIYGIGAGLRDSGAKEEANLPIYCAVVLYSLTTVVVISYLYSNPIVEGQALSVESVYGFTPTGVNAIYIISSSSSLFALCSIALAGSKTGRAKKAPYKSVLLANARGMVIFILLEFIVCFAGLTFLFGLGSANLPMLLLTASAQTLLLLTYSAVFSMLSEMIRNKAAFVISGMLYILVESLSAAVFMSTHNLFFVSGMFPSYYITAINENALSPMLMLRVCVVSFLYIGSASLVGYLRHLNTRE